MPPAPMLIFDVDDAGSRPMGLGHSRGVRLVGRVRPAGRGWDPDTGRTAVLLLRARPQSAHPAGPLTRRELDVVRMLADGDSTRDIAQRLSYSERTVKNIVRDLLVKLNCRTRAHAVALATRQGLI